MLVCDEGATKSDELKSVPPQKLINKQFIKRIHFAS